MVKQSVHTLFFVPLVMLALGIITQSIVQCSVIICLLLFCVGTVTLAWLAYRSWITMCVMVWWVCFCAGLLLLCLQRAQCEDLRNQYTGKPLTIKARVIDVQSCTGGLFEGFAQVQVEQVKGSGEDHYHSADFSFFCYHKQVFNWMVGDQVLFEDLVLSTPSENALENNASYGDYLIKEHVIASVFLQKKNYVCVIDRPSWSVKRWIWLQKYRILSSIKEKVSPLAYAYFALIFLGYKQLEQNHTLRKVFNLWGLAHFLARAGLHIMLFIWIWQLFLGLLPLPGVVKRGVLFFVCGVYALFSWISIPFFRAYVVFVLGRCATMVDQQINFLHLLTVSCLFVLLFNPMYIFFLDFQLTYALTFVLGWFSQLKIERFS